MRTNPKLLFWLGIIIIVVGMIALVPLYFLEVPGNNSEILSMGIGVLLGWGSMAVSFYFGQSEDRNQKP